MAIDSRDKRASALNDDWPIVLPNPDGTIDTTDRQHLGWAYRGIAAGAAVVSDLLSAIVLRTIRFEAFPFKTSVLKHEFTQ